MNRFTQFNTDALMSRRSFFSWQPDIHGHGEYLRRHIQSTIDQLNVVASGDISYKLDEATSDESGAFKIDTTILVKSKKCRVFNVDLSIVHQSPKRSQSEQTQMCCSRPNMHYKHWNGNT